MRIIAGFLIVLGGLVFSVVILEGILNIANGEANWGAETFKMWLLGGVFAFVVFSYWLAIYSKASNDKDNR